MNQLVANRLIENETQGNSNANVRHEFNNEADFTAWLEMEKNQLACVYKDTYSGVRKYPVNEPIMLYTTRKMNF